MNLSYTPSHIARRLPSCSRSPQKHKTSADIEPRETSLKRPTSLATPGTHLGIRAKLFAAEEEVHLPKLRELAEPAGQSSRPFRASRKSHTVVWRGKGKGHCGRGLAMTSLWKNRFTSLAIVMQSTRQHPCKASASQSGSQVTDRSCR